MPAKFTTTAGPNLPEIEEEVASELAFITRHISPLLLAIGFPDNLKVIHNPKHSWQETALLGNYATVNGAIGAGITAIVVDSPLGSNFRAGDEVAIDGSNELMLVASVTPTVVNVTRGIKGTTPVAIPDNALLERVGNPSIENANAQSARPTSRTPVFNFSQVFEDQAQVTRSMEKSNLLAGVADEMDLQIDHVMADLMRDIAKTVNLGKQQLVNPEGNGGQARTMNGIIHSILNGNNPSVLDAQGGGLDERLLNLLLEDMFTKGGDAKILAAPPAQKRRISALLQGRQRYRPEDTMLGAIVEEFESDFGTLRLLKPDIFIPRDTIYMLDPAKIRMVKLGDEGDPFEVEDLAKTGLVSSRQVVGEFGLEIPNAGDGGHGMIQNLATN